VEYLCEGNNEGLDEQSGAPIDGKHEECAEPQQQLDMKEECGSSSNCGWRTSKTGRYNKRDERKIRVNVGILRLSGRGER